MIEKRKSDVDVEFILNEGSVGTIGAVKKGQILFPVQVGEKGSAWLRLEAKGVPGHGSKPPTQTLTSVQKLLRALARIEKKGTEFEVTPEVRKFFYELGKSQDFPNSFILKNIDSRLIQRLAGGLIAKSTSMNAILRNTISITRLEGSEKVNVIPTNAIAEIDCRLLPGTDPDEFTEQIRRTINDEDITVTRFFGRAASSSPSENELYLTIGASIKKFHPDAVIAPFLTPAQTDTAFFRAIGIPSYGMIPGVFTSEEIDLIHGNDEYISIENLVNGTKIIYLTIKTIVK
ncbi:MAG: M20/M25/M40 family metallo-hydrolase [Leptospira sp.]|nr:M20/M25/M40 family metallo-hydrolase [Leptospira sp.]